MGNEVMRAALGYFTCTRNMPKTGGPPSPLTTCYRLSAYCHLPVLTDKHARKHRETGLGQVKPGSGPRLGPVKAGSGPGMGPVKAGSGLRLGPVKAGSGPELGLVKAGSGPGLGPVKVGSGGVASKASSVVGSDRAARDRQQQWD